MDGPGGDPGGNALGGNGFAGVVEAGGAVLGQTEPRAEAEQAAAFGVQPPGVVGESGRGVA